VLIINGLFCGFVVDHDFYFGDTVAVELGYFESEVLEIDALVESGEIALDLQEQSAKGVGIALYFLEGLIVEVENLIEIT
jgi:hypothetical protein